MGAARFHFGAAAFAAAAFFTALPAWAQEVSKLATMVDWALYTDAASPHLFCFITSAPKSSDPADTKREAPRVYISAWPKDGVKGEFSVRLGFPAKKGTEITAAVGTQTFRMFASSERAFVQDATAELKLLEAMRKGARLSVSATTATGTAVTDSYSLSGLGQAMGELQSTCF
jgi:invasion protein IalB